MLRILSLIGAHTNLEVIDMRTNSQGPELPLGLGMALMQNLQAMRHFSSLSNEEQQALIDQTHSIGSKQEMRAFVDRLAP